MNPYFKRLSLSGQVRMLWVVALCVLSGGYFATTERYEQKILASTQRAQTLYDKATLNRRLISQSGKAQALRLELRAHLKGVLFAPDSSLATATMLRDLDVLAHRYGTQITAVAPQERSKNPSPITIAPLAAKPVGSEPLQNEVVEIAVRGHFSALLAFVAELTRQHVLLRVNQVSFSLSGARKTDSNSPILDAKIYTLVYRLTKQNLMGEL